jgi:hypothetical protein
MMTLSVSSGTWNDAVAAGYGHTSDDEPATFEDIERVLRAALRELNIEMKVEVQAEIPGV